VKHKRLSPRSVAATKGAIIARLSVWGKEGVLILIVGQQINMGLPQGRTDETNGAELSHSVQEQLQYSPSFRIMTM
jgi:hypothetical protein